MADITTDACKKKLIELYPNTHIKSWKRMRKYLNTLREVERVFECTQAGLARSVVLVERDGKLEVICGGTTAAMGPIVAPANSGASASAGLHPLPAGLTPVTGSVDMRRVLFGA